MMVKNYRPASAGMVPAAPGTYLAHAYFDGDEVDLVKCAVIGWSVSTERLVTPLVIDPRAADSEPWFVIQPDGRVECSDGRVWLDADSWIADERRARRELSVAQTLAIATTPQAATAPDAAAPQPVSPTVPGPASIPQGMAEPAPAKAPPQPVSAPRPSGPYGAPVL